MRCCAVRARRGAVVAARREAGSRELSTARVDAQRLVATAATVTGHQLTKAGTELLAEEAVDDRVDAAVGGTWNG